jgi:hypothetical protein
MAKENVLNICDSLDRYLSSAHIPLAVLLIGKTKEAAKQGTPDYKIRSLSFGGSDAQKLNRIISDFSKKVRGFVEG